MPDVFTAREIERIVEQAQDAGLDAISCPRDGTRIVCEPLTYRETERGEQGRGVKLGDFKDVQSISVECPKCGTQAGGVSVLRR